MFEINQTSHALLQYLYVPHVQYYTGIHKNFGVEDLRSEIWVFMALNPTYDISFASHIRFTSYVICGF